MRKTSIATFLSIATLTVAGCSANTLNPSKIPQEVMDEYGILCPQKGDCSSQIEKYIQKNTVDWGNEDNICSLTQGIDVTVGEPSEEDPIYSMVIELTSLVDKDKYTIKPDKSVYLNKQTGKPQSTPSGLTETWVTATDYEEQIVKQIDDTKAAVYPNGEGRWVILHLNPFHVSAESVEVLNYSPDFKNTQNVDCSNFRATHPEQVSIESALISGKSSTYIRNNPIDIRKNRWGEYYLYTGNNTPESISASTVEEDYTIVDSQYFSNQEYLLVQSPWQETKTVHSAKGDVLTINPREYAVIQNGGIIEIISKEEADSQFIRTKP